MKIEGYFRTIKAGNEAVEKLKASGFQGAYSDINDHYNEDRNVQINQPGTENSVSLSGLVLESESHGISRDKAPLDAASPMVSGFGRFEEVMDVNCKVIVEAKKGEAERAKKIITEMGGTLESPNFIKPKLKDEDEMAVYKTLDNNRKFIEQEEK